MTFDQKAFLPNGKFLNDIPQGGLDNFTASAKNPVYTYTLNGSKGKLCHRQPRFLLTSFQ
jgi:hypothetical protein